jgi:putative hydrolase of the HAD superfamily
VIEAVLFDFDHTLGVDNKLEETVLHDLTGRYCAAPLSGQDIALALARFRRGREPLAAMVSRAFDGCSCGADMLAEYKAAVLQLLPERLEAMPGATATIAALEARGLTVAILSNGWTELQLAKASGIGYEGPVFVSESLGVWKPDVRAFRIAADALGISLRRSMYVGDSPPSDVVGAKGAGMVAVWAALEGQTYPDDIVRPDHTITSLGQMVEIVEAHGRGGRP